jgi:hypothetical protein
VCCYNLLATPLAYRSLAVKSNPYAKKFARVARYGKNEYAPARTQLRERTYT